MAVRESKKKLLVFLTHMQKKLSELKYPSQVADELSRELNDKTINKQKVGFWIRKMISWKMIEELPESTRFMRLYRVIKWIALSEAMGSNEHIYTFHPHNYRVKVKILSDNENAHLPVMKKTGKNGSVPKEYEFLKDMTFERTKNYITVILRHRGTDIIQKPNDFDSIEDYLKKTSENALKRFQERYLMKLDMANMEVTNTDSKIKGGIITKIPAWIRFHDTVGKRVYPDAFEFKDIPTTKRFFENMALKDFSPDIANAISEMREKLGGMVQQSIATSNAILLIAKTQESQTKILESLVGKKKTIPQKVHKKTSEYWKMIRKASKHTGMPISVVRREFKKMMVR